MQLTVLVELAAGSLLTVGSLRCRDNNACLSITWKAKVRQMCLMHSQGQCVTQRAPRKGPTAPTEDPTWVLSFPGRKLPHSPEFTFLLAVISINILV